jgi:hypothetical protein
MSVVLASALALVSVAVVAVVVSVRGTHAAPDSDAVQYPGATSTASAVAGSDDAEAFTAAALASADVHAMAPTGTDFVISTVEVADDVGVLYGGFRNGVSDEPVPTEPVTVLGEKRDGRWTTVVPGDAAFCLTLNRVPGSLLSATEKAYFIGCEVN